jgi:PAS domain S-box-containing protein
VSAERKRVGRPRQRRAPLNEARWQAVLETTRDAIVSIDSHGAITLFNRSAETIFGYRAEEVLGHNVALLMPAPFAEEHDGYLHAYRETGVAKAIGQLREAIGRRKDGSLFPIELSLAEAQGGRNAAYVAIIRDISERRDSEEALRREVDLAERLIETAPVIVLVLDTEGRIVRFNSYMEEISGYQLSEVQGKDWLTTLLPRRDHARIREQFARAATGTPIRGYINTTVTRAGAEREIEWNASALHDAQGHVAGVLCIGHDITGRQRATRRLVAGYTVTRILAAAASLSAAAPTLLRAICDAIGWEVGELWRVDAAAEVLRCEATWHSSVIDGAAFDAVSRTTTFARGSGLQGGVWASGEPAWIAEPADAADVPRSAAARLGLRGAVAFPVRTGETVIGVMAFFRPDGQPPDGDLLQMLDALGRQIGGFVERHEAAAALRESERRFALFMHHLPGVAFMKDAQGRYVYVNERFELLYHRTLRELFGRTDAEIWPADAARQFSANDQQVMERRTALLTTERVPHDDGLHDWLVNKFPILDASGAVMMVGGIAVDVTERLKAEAELRALQKQAHQRERLADIGALSAEIIHHIGNPLAALSMQAQLILRRARRDEEQPVRAMIPAAEQIVREAHRVHSLIGEFLDFSREQRLDIKEISLTALLRELVETWEPVATPRGITLALDLEVENVAVRGDADKLRRVFDNLLRNAIEAIEAGPGCVAIHVTLPTPEKVCIALEDSGSGIAESVQVFRLFETTKANGTGLGLPIAKQIVLAHGGKLEFEAARPHGTVFHVELPRRGPLT